MSEQHSEIPDLNELESKGSFNQDLIAELDWMQEKKRRVELNEAVYNDRRERDTAEEKRLIELREGRVARGLGENYDQFAPSEKFETTKALRLATVARHNQVRESQKAVDPTYQTGGYDSIEISVLDKYMQDAATEWYEQDAEAFLIKLRTTIADRIPESLDVSLSAHSFKMELLSEYDHQQQVMLTTLYTKDGLDPAMNQYAEAVQDAYKVRLQDRHNQEETVMTADHSTEWGIDNLGLPPIEDDPEFVAIVAANQRPSELDDLENKLVREEFIRCVDPNNYKLRTEEPVLLERRKEELLTAWHQQFSTALKPLILRRYDDLRSLYVNGEKGIFEDPSDERESSDHVRLGRTIVPVQAIVANNYSGDWRILNGKTGSGSGDHSPTTIVDIATRLAIGTYSEANKNGDNGSIFAHRGPNGTIAYEADAGVHRVAAHKLIGKQTIIMNCIAPDMVIAQELEQAVL